MRQEQKDNMLFAYMRSIDKSLGRIATALEDMQKQQEIKNYAGTDDEYDGCLRVIQPMDISATLYDRDDLK